MARRIPDSFIDQLLGRTDIVEIINSMVPLKKSGANYVACCPFHNEKTPSFSVSPKKQFYHCFGCGASGSALTFLMKYQNMEFLDAVETLARRAGMQMPERTKASYTPQQERAYARGFEVLKRAGEYFHAQLKKSSKASDYLKQRGLSEETVRQYGLGYAPTGGYLRDCFGERHDAKALTDAGLLRAGDSGSYPVFRDRIIFPIRDRKGRVIAFGGRALEADVKAKYINSPETMFYKKSRTIYGEYELRSQRNIQSVFVVEGYMDVVSLAQNGVTNVAATLGTSVTQDHIRLLLRLCSKIVFCFDGDEAGYRAAAKAMEQSLPCMRDTASMGFMFLPSEHDPDSFVAQHGAEKFMREAESALPLSDFLFEHLARDQDAQSTEGRAQLASEALKLITMIPRGTAFRALMNKRLAEKTGLSEDDVSARESAQTRSPTKRHARGADTTDVAARAIKFVLHHLELAADVDASVARALRESQNSAEKFLGELVEYIVAQNITRPAAVLTRYEGTRYHERLTQLLAEEAPPLTNETRVEFAEMMARFVDDERREYERLLAKAERGGELSADEKRRLNELAVKQPRRSHSAAAT